MSLKFFLVKKPNAFFYPKRNVYILTIGSKEIANLMKEYLFWENKKGNSVRLKTTNHSKEFLKGFLRGFLDCDGYTYKKQRKVSMFCISEKMMKQIFSIVRDFGFEPEFYVYYDKRKNRKPLFFVNLLKKDATNFIEFVQPRNEKRKRMGPPGFEIPHLSIREMSGV